MEPTTTPTYSTIQRRIRRSPDQWREIMARFERSGQTREQFCTEQGLGLSTFSRWRRSLSREVPVAPAHSDDALFVELARAAPEPPAQAWDVELQLGAGVCLRLRQSAC